MAQVLAIYPHTDVDFFNNIASSVSFVTLDNLYDNISNETRLIVIKDKDNESIVTAIRKAYVLLETICVGSNFEADSRTTICEEKDLQEHITTKLADNRVLFHDSELQQAIDTVKKVNADIILYTGVGYLGEVAMEYVNNGDPVLSFDMSQIEESHLITQVSSMISQNKNKFLCFYLHNFDSLLTLISVMKWFSQNKNYTSRVVFCVNNSDWLDNLPEELFDKYYTLQVPPLWQRPKDILGLIDSYDYQSLSKNFLQFVFNYTFPENESELLQILNQSYDHNSKTFNLKRL